LRLFPAILV
jgi:hypothetical protein